jgi:hydroxyacylglutathione hydrolase
MILQRFYDEKLAHASYVVGCPGAGEAVVIDPARDVEPYLEFARREGLRVRFVAETHIHADYVSGVRELAKRTGATAVLSDEGDVDWKYGYADEIGAMLVRDGDSFRVGAVRFDVMRTPGHTPEHVIFVMTDEAASTEPQAVFSGDFVFVGDVGRPDLLEQAAGVAGTQEPGARSLFSSLTRFKALPDHVMVWPAHGAGSACGKSLGGVPVSTVGYERASNWALRAAGEDSFVREVLSGQPEPPFYFAMMKRLNKVGPPLLAELPSARHEADPGRLLAALGAGATVIDARPTAEWVKGAVPGAIHVPMGKQFPTWAGWFVPYDRDIVLIVPDGATASQAVKDLASIGLDRVVAWYLPDALETMRLEPVAQVRANEVPEGGRFLDVRNRSEWDAGHLDGALHVPLGHLERRADEIPRGTRLFVHCQGGARSPVAVSVLRRLGFTDVVDVTDGYRGLSQIQRPAAV